MGRVDSDGEASGLLSALPAASCALPAKTCHDLGSPFLLGKPLLRGCDRFLRETVGSVSLLDAASDCELLTQVWKPGIRHLDALPCA